MKIKMKLSFVCIGVQKAGTTSLHDILKQHPKIGLPDIKEAPFFIDDFKFQKGINNYFKDYFKESDKNLLLGEINPQFCYVPKVAERIKNNFGEVKIIILLRNPVDRAFSHYLMTKRRGLEPLSFEDALLSEKERLGTEHGDLNHSYISRGNYTNQIERYQKLFGDENLKVILFDEFIRNTPKVTREICEFINVEDFDFDFSIQSNPASESKSKLLGNFLYRPSFIKRILGRLLLSQKRKDKVALALDKMNLKEAKKESLSNELKQNIYNNYFQQEIENLEKVLNKDLSNWKAFITNSSRESIDINEK
jgi:hypothetical protein